MKSDQVVKRDNVARVMVFCSLIGTFAEFANGLDYFYSRLGAASLVSVGCIALIINIKRDKGHNKLFNLISSILLVLTSIIYASKQYNFPTQPVPPSIITITPNSAISSSDIEIISPRETPAVINTLLLKENFDDYAVENFFPQNGYYHFQEPNGVNILSVAYGSFYNSDVYFGDSSWKNYSISYDFMFLDCNSECEGMHLIFRKLYGRDSNYIFRHVPARGGYVSVDAAKPSGWEGLAITPYVFEDNIWYSAKLDINQQNIKGYINNELIIDIEDKKYNYDQGFSGWGVFNYNGEADPLTNILLDNLEVHLLNIDPPTD